MVKTKWSFIVEILDALLSLRHIFEANVTIVEVVVGFPCGSVLLNVFLELDGQHLTCFAHLLLELLFLHILWNELHEDVSLEVLLHLLGDGGVVLVELVLNLGDVLLDEDVLSADLFLLMQGIDCKLALVVGGVLDEAGALANLKSDRLDVAEFFEQFLELWLSEISWQVGHVQVGQVLDCFVALGPLQEHGH